MSDFGNHEFSPVNQFRFCPRCGSPGLNRASDRSLTCPGCGLVYYFNMSAAAAGLIFDDQNRLLLTIRAHEPAKGMLDLPGGFLEMGESAEDGLKREIYEELQLRVEPVEFIGSFPNQYLYRDLLYETIDLLYVCKAKNLDTIKPGDDVAGFAFEKLESLDPDSVGLKSIREIIKFLKRKKPIDI